VSAPADEAKARRTPLIVHLGLFLTTFVTTTATGALEAHQGHGIVPIADGLRYSVPLLAILLCHELGHYVVARWHGVDASLPYFIPLPPGLGLGTLGAVIGMRDVTSDRKKLIDIGAAGPLAGLIVAAPILFYGLAHSPVAASSAGGQQEGNSIFYALAKHAVTGLWLPGGGRDVLLSPTGYAAWAGLLLTMINLFPIGQLDGGHIATAYFGNRYNRVAGHLQRLMPVMALGVFGWVLHLVRLESGAHWDLGAAVGIAAGASLVWLVWFVVVGLLRRLSGGVNHPPVEDKPLARSRRALFWVMVIVFVGTFMPVPSRAIYAPDRPSAAVGRR
jgi:membrane-associated protease RseP (regulator of RpoE activity)